MLDGQGADEILGGYLGYLPAANSSLGSGPRWVASRLRVVARRLRDCDPGRRGPRVRAVSDLLRRTAPARPASTKVRRPAR